MIIIKKLQIGWSKLSTAEKIGVVIDLITAIGGGCVGGVIGDMAGTKAHTKIGWVCAKVTGFGVGLAATDLASTALRREYGDVIGECLDKAKAKNQKKEGAQNA